MVGLLHNLHRTVTSVAINDANGEITVTFTAAAGATAGRDTIVFVPTTSVAAQAAIAGVPAGCTFPATGAAGEVVCTSPPVAAVAAQAAVPLAVGVAPVGQIAWSCTGGTLPSKYRSGTCRS
jgi:hypothetical protein